MAILKTIKTDYGVAAEYWHIQTVQENFVQKYIDITFLGYATAEARRTGCQNMAAGTARISGEEYVAGADRATLYSIIKQRPEFEGAEDA